MRTALTAAALAAGLVLAAPATPALAHNKLESAAPAEDSTLRTAPGQVRLTFTDRLSSLLTVVVTDEAKQKVPTAPPAVTRATATVRFTAPLANGAYTVAYRVVSSDGHTVQGTYGFRVAAPTPAGTTAAPTPAPAATTARATPVETIPAVPAAEATAEEDGGVPTAAMIGLPVLLLAAGGLVLARRRRT